MAASVTATPAAPGGARGVAPDTSGLYVSFLGLVAAGYIGLLVFVFAYGLYGDELTAGVDVACAEAAFKNGKAMEARGKYDVALLRYRQALEGRFQDPDRMYQCARSVGEVLFRLGRYQEAVEAYRTFPPQAFREPGHWAAYVASLWNCSDYAETERLGLVWLAAAEERAARETDPAKRKELSQQQVWAHVTLGRLYERTNRLDDALRQLDSATALDPANHAAILAAQVLNRQDKTAEAVRRLDTYMKTTGSGPNYQEARQLRARLAQSPG